MNPLHKFQLPAASYSFLQDRSEIGSLGCSLTVNIAGPRFFSQICIIFHKFAGLGLPATDQAEREAKIVKAKALAERKKGVSDEAFRTAVKALNLL